jgi:glycosyltransferase involved in cell wall biosynthesis
MGGASRAAQRLHNALVASSDIQSAMIVRQRINDDWRVSQPGGNIIAKGLRAILPSIDGFPTRLQDSASSVPRSSAFVSSINAAKVNMSDSDVINLHWICGGLLSVETIGKIRKPVVWTLHDMWPFCGAEHLTKDEVSSRWRIGYDKENRDPMDRGLDIDRWVWRRKRKSWKNPFHIVAPSNWLAECARSSALLCNWNVTVIPNVIDTSRFSPIGKALARKILRLPLEAKLVLFGAIRGTQLSYKGWDLLQPALTKLAALLPDAQAVIFGQSEPKNPPSLGIRMHWMGHLYDDATLSLLYSAADVMVVPSRQESFCQTGSEAHACGCPVVAFGATGLLDVVAHGTTGYLAEPFSSEDLANGIAWVLTDEERHAQMSAQARHRAVSLWSHEVVVPQYMAVYRSAVGLNSG